MTPVSSSPRRVLQAPAPGLADRSLDPNLGWVLAGREPPVTQRPGAGPDLPESAMVRASVVLVVGPGPAASGFVARLRSLLGRLGGDDEVVLVDRGDPESSWARELDDVRVRRLPLLAGTSFAWACNLGIRHAWGRILVVASSTADLHSITPAIDALVDTGGLVVEAATTRASAPTRSGGPPGGGWVLAAWRAGLVGRVGYLDVASDEPFGDWLERIAAAFVRPVRHRVVVDRDATGVDSSGHWREVTTPRATRPSSTPVTARFPVRREPVTATMASIPSRRAHLRQVVTTLLPQVDWLMVHLNDYADVPACLSHPRVVVSRSQEAGDLRDTGKFVFRDRIPRGYHVVVDDDIDYPPDHVDQLVAKVEQYDRRAVVGYHGVQLELPVRSYYSGRAVAHFGTALREDHPVHVLGTGTVALHTDMLRIGVEDCREHGMTDIWFAAACHQAGIRLVAAARPTRYLLQLPQDGPTLYDEFRDHDERLVEVLRGLPLASLAAPLPSR